MPTPKQINNWLENKRRALKLSHLEKLDIWVSEKSKFLIYPKDKIPSDLFRNSNMILIVQFGDYLFAKFRSLINDGAVVGLDAQYVNNCLRRPLYVLCAQDSLTFRTVPGSVMLLAKNDMIHLQEGLQIIKNHLKEMKCKFRKKFMIDQCNVERGAVRYVGSSVVLCNFHVQRTINRRLKSMDTDSSKKMMKLVKKIQRCSSEDQLFELIKMMSDQCITKAEKTFYKWC